MFSKIASAAMCATFLALGVANAGDLAVRSKGGNLVEVGRGEKKASVATCGEDEVVTGGGFIQTPRGVKELSSALQIVQSRPLGERKWQVIVTNDSTFGGKLRGRATVRCAKTVSTASGPALTSGTVLLVTTAGCPSGTSDISGPNKDRYIIVRDDVSGSAKIIPASDAHTHIVDPGIKLEPTRTTVEVSSSAGPSKVALGEHGHGVTGTTLGPTKPAGPNTSHQHAAIGLRLCRVN